LDSVSLAAKDIQKLAKQSYRFFKDNPYHPGLHFKELITTRPLFSVRIGLGYRALGLKVSEQEIVWFWIGTHAD